MNNLAHLVLRTKPNGAVFFTDALTGKSFFPCNERGTILDITTNTLDYLEYLRSIGDSEIHSLDGFFKKVSDRLFKDFPKAFTNAITSPFTSEPIYKQEDFQDSMYGKSASSLKNNKIAGQAGQIAASVVLGPTTSAKFMAAGNTATSFLQRNQSGNPSDQAAQQPTSQEQPGDIKKDSAMLWVGAVGILVAGFLIYFTSQSEEGDN